jgi:hypothetical protein
LKFLLGKVAASGLAAQQLARRRLFLMQNLNDDIAAAGASVRKRGNQ